MGIVAFCPNGHRIKVKDELAGRKGICPTCEARFRIPRPDAHAASHPDARQDLPSATIVSRDPQVAATLPAAHALSDAVTSEPIDATVEPPDAAPDFAPLHDDPAVNVPMADDPHGAHPALEERPDLAWCVALRGGPPSAPLTAAAMRDWLGSDAASADHVVWRQDWPDWRPIAEVFPETLPPQPPGWP